MKPPNIATPPPLSAGLAPQGREGIGHRINPLHAALHLANAARLSAMDKAAAMASVAANPRVAKLMPPVPGA